MFTDRRYVAIGSEETLLSKRAAVLQSIPQRVLCAWQCSRASLSCFMANVGPFHFEYGQVDIDQIVPNPVGEAVTLETMQRALQNIGSLQNWASKYGHMVKHSPDLITRVELLVSTGVTDADFPGGWDANSRMFPTATRATLWILLYTEHDGDDQLLYSKLAESAKGVSWVDNPANAKKCLRRIVDEMTREGMPQFSAQLELLDAGGMAATSLVSDS